MGVKQAQEWNVRFKDQDPQDVLRFFFSHFGKRILLASSLGLEDQVLTHMLFTIQKDFRVFVLDTGRLPQETYDLLHRMRSGYGIEYDVYFPDTAVVEKMVKDKGPNLFYESVENRKLCCYVRKVEPLKRALAGAEAWITGLRRDQSVTRDSLAVVEWDDAHQMLKINPLASWTLDQVWAYIRAHQVPYNVLHDKGYPSIGCAPCTRAVGPGEDVRAGRWWWENPDQKECGLHWKDGKLVRKAGNL